VRPAAEATTTVTGKNFAPLGGERLRCVFGEPGAAAGGGDTADASAGKSPAGGGGIFSGWFGRRLRERMAVEAGDNQRTDTHGGRPQLPAATEAGVLEVSVPASFVSGNVLRCAAPSWARAATATLRVAVHPAAADAAGAADTVLSAQLPFYFYVAGLAPTLDPAPPIGLDISAYLARRVGAAGDGGSAGALARNLTLRGQHLLPFPGAMAIAFGDVGVVGARFVQP